MQSALNPVVNLYQTQLEASRRCAEALCSGMERIDRIILDATHRMLNQQLTFVQSVAGGGDPKSAITALQSSLMSQTPTEAMNSQRELMSIVTEMQNAIGKSLQEYMVRMGAGAQAVPALRQDAGPRQADTPYNPVTGIFSVWESAFKEAAALARRSMATTRSTMEEAAIAGARNAAAFTAMPTHVIEDAASAARRTMIAGMAEGGSASGAEPAQENDERRGTAGKRK
jgi:hypothetical protein